MGTDIFVGSIRKKLNLMSKAADSIAQGDVAESLIRSNQAWGILPVHVSFETYFWLQRFETLQILNLTNVFTSNRLYIQLSHPALS